MKSMILVALALVAVAAAAPVEPEPVPIIRSDFQQQPEGGYQFGFETGDRTVRDETGELKEALDEDNKPQKFIAVRGSYSYIDKEGHQQTVNYYADETGYHAEGDSIPKPARR